MVLTRHEVGARVVEVFVTAARRASLVLSGVSLVLGLGGLVVARDLAFTAARGEIVLGLGVSFNLLGALLTVALSIVAISGALLGSNAGLLAAAGGYAVAAVQVVAQFGRDTNWLGTRGSNLSMFLALAVGLWSLVWLDRHTAD
jgi:hypothetical protein